MRRYEVNVGTLLIEHYVPPNIPASNSPGSLPDVAELDSERFSTVTANISSYYDHQSSSVFEGVLRIVEPERTVGYIPLPDSTYLDLISNIRKGDLEIFDFVALSILRLGRYNMMSLKCKDYSEFLELDSVVTIDRRWPSIYKLFALHYETELTKDGIDIRREVPLPVLCEWIGKLVDIGKISSIKVRNEWEQLSNYRESNGACGTMAIN